MGDVGIIEAKLLYARRSNLGQSEPQTSLRTNKFEVVIFLGCRGYADHHCIGRNKLLFNNTAAKRFLRHTKTGVHPGQLQVDDARG